MRFSGNSFTLFLIVILSVGVGQTFAQKSEDWSALFPEIPNCTRKINPLEQTIDGIYQSAVYTKDGALCLTVALALNFPAKKSENRNNEMKNFPWVRRIKVLNYEAYKVGSMCGLDRSPGSIFVNFDRNKSIWITSYEYDYLITGELADGRNSLLKIAKIINYPLLIKSMNKLKLQKM
jgi:hypothetical protein